MRRTDFIMGMPVVIDIPGLQNESIIQEAFNELKKVDEQFSPFKPDSELSRFKRGELSAETVSIGMKAVMKACLEAERYTGGFFSARYSGEFDPSGFVKGWAVGEVKNRLLEKGFSTFCISAGGDVVTKSSGDKTWRIGIQHPKKKSKVLGTVLAKNLAIATSGSYARGRHIINPKTKKPATFFLSLTVAGPNITKADVFATTAMAMGVDGLGFIDKHRGFEVLAVDKDGKIYLSGGMARLLESNLTITGEVV